MAEIIISPSSAALHLFPCTVITPAILEARVSCLRLFPKSRNSYGLPRVSGLQIVSRRCLHAICFAHLNKEDNTRFELSTPVPGVSDSNKVSDSSTTSNLSPGVITGLAVVGFLETAYLTWTKISGGSVVCPVGGVSCSSVLDSDYAELFGFPLPLMGVVMYGVVAFLAWSMRQTHSAVSIDEAGFKRWLLLGCTTTMATASAYLMYILQVAFAGTFCAYCVASALLSFSLLFLTLRGFTSNDLKKVAGLQLAIVAAVVITFSAAFEKSTSALAGSADIYLPPVEPEVTTVSSSIQFSLAKHLNMIGAKMYGAFWCSHCHEQKEMFGREAMKYINYVECYPDGYQKGVQIAKACEAQNIQGFPTWIINDQVISGEQDFRELARVSGFDLSAASS